MRKPLRDKLFEEKLASDYLQDEYVAITSAVNKGIKLQEEENYIVQGVARCLETSNIESSEDAIVDNLVQEYTKKELFFNPQMNVMVYDLMVELLYNIGQVSYVPDEDIEKRLKVAENEALKYWGKEGLFEEFLALAEMGCARAMYSVAHYYDYGYGDVVEDKEKAREWYKKGMELGDMLCKAKYAQKYIDDYAEERKMCQEAYSALKKFAEDGDVFVILEVYPWYIDDLEEQKYWLEKHLNFEKREFWERVSW